MIADNSDLAVCGDGCGDVRRSGRGGKRLDDAGSLVEDLDEDDSLNAECPVAPFLSRTAEFFAAAPSCHQYDSIIILLLVFFVQKAFLTVPVKTFIVKSGTCFPVTVNRP